MTAQIRKAATLALGLALLAAPVDRAAAQGFPGYHDLYMDYLNGPITWCPSACGRNWRAA